MAVAFLKPTGLDKIIESLRAGAAVGIFVGSDFCSTDPKALKTLLDLSKRHTSLDVFLAKAEARSTFHPKLYLGIVAHGARVLMGSSNLTGGGLTTNEEVSLRWRLDLGETLLVQLRGVFVTSRSKTRFEELDDIVLELYRRDFKKAQDAKKRAEKEIAAADGATFDLAKLTPLHRLASPK
jgi:HKD family nuclease